MKPVGGRGRVWLCLVLKLICRTMASPKDSSLTQLLQGMLSYEELHLLKTLTILPPRQLLMPESLMTTMMLLHHLQLRRVSTLHQVLLHRQTPTPTLHLLLLLLGTSRGSMSSYLFGPYWQKGEKLMSLIVFKRVHMGGCIIFCLVFTTLALDTFGSWVVTLKLDGRLLLICHLVLRW